MATLTELFTRPEAAAYLRVKPETLAAWAHHRRYPLPFVKLGRRVVYKKTDLDQFIDRQRQGAETVTA